MSKIFRKKYLNYPAGIVGKDDKGKTRVKQVQHSTSAPVVYISNKWGGKWARIDTFDVQSIELRSASAGEDTCIIKYRYGHIAYPNAPDKKWKTVNTKRFTGKTMWVRVMEDKLILFQGVLTNVDDEFYGRGKDNGAGVESGVQTFTFKGGLFLLGRFRFYQSAWHTEKGSFNEIAGGVNKNEKDWLIDWIPDFGGESVKYCDFDKPEMEIRDSALGNMKIFTEKPAWNEAERKKQKKYIAFGGDELFRPEGAFAYLAKLIDLKNWDAPKFDVDMRYIQDEIAGKQIEAEPVMNARDFLLKAFDVSSGYDFYFEPTKEGYTIVPFPRENNDTYFWVNPQHTAVVNCTLSRNMEDYYTAVRVVGERIVISWQGIRQFFPVRNPVGVNINDTDDNGALCMFDMFETRKDYCDIRIGEISIDKNGKANIDWNNITSLFEQTKYRSVLTDFYYDFTTEEKLDKGPFLWFDGRSYNKNHGGSVIDQDNIQWVEAKGLEVGVEPFEQAIGVKLKVKDWTRLLDGKMYSFNNGAVADGEGIADNDESFENWHVDANNFPIELRKKEVPDICVRLFKFHLAFEIDQRFKYVFGDYQDEYRTLTVYEKDARLVLSFATGMNIAGGSFGKAVRNDFDKLKKRYEAILKEYRKPPSNLTCQMKGILSPAILGKRITVAGDNVSQDTNTSLTHISYTFPEGKSPQTRI